MKKKIVLILIIVIALCGCSKNDSKDVLNVLNWSSYIPDDVISDFEKETGIKVNYNTYSSNEELLAKVTASKQGTYDVVFPSDYMVEVMKERKLLKELDKSQLNNLANLNNHFMDEYFDRGNTYSLPFLLTMPLVAYDTTKVKEDITSYNDLLNKKYKEDIVLLDDQRIIIGMGLIATGSDFNSTDERQLDTAKKWLLKLRPNVKAYDSDSPKSFLITEEASIAYLWSAEAAIAMEENPNIKVVFPAEGSAKSMDNMTILKGAKNEENAYKFIDYILRNDIMKRIIDYYPYKNLHNDPNHYIVPLEKSRLIDGTPNIAYDIPLKDIDRGYYVKNIGDTIRVYDEIWTMIK